MSISTDYSDQTICKVSLKLIKVELKDVCQDLVLDL